MEADSSSIFDILAWPVFPDQPWAQAAFIAALVLGVAGVLMLAVPATCGRVLGLEGSQRRPGGIGELRAVGGFLGGFALATLMFFDQPVLPAGLGVAMALAAFARLISLMSDMSASLLNVLLFLVQSLFAVALLTFLGEALSEELKFGVPTSLVPQLLFFTFAAVAAIGLIVLFAPRIAMNAAGLWVLADKPGGIASVRSTGGFMLGAGLFGVVVAGYWDTQFAVLLMFGFGMAFALALSVLGRLLALVFERGNLVFNAIALAAQVAAALVVTTYISTAM